MQWVEPLTGVFPMLGEGPNVVTPIRAQGEEQGDNQGSCAAGCGGNGSDTVGREPFCGCKENLDREKVKGWGWPHCRCHFEHFLNM